MKKKKKKRLRRRTAECTLYFDREYFLSITYSLLHICSVKGETNELSFFGLPGRVVKPRWKRYSRTMLIESPKKKKKKKTGLDQGKR